MMEGRRCGIIDGSSLLAESLIHDFEEIGFGGQGLMGIGGRGTGKTTYMQRHIQRVSHLDSDRVSKTEYMDVYYRRKRKEAKMLSAGYAPEDIPDALPKFPCKEVPETVVYYGREFDYWHNFLETRIWEEYPNPKPVRIHLPQGEEFHFVVQFGDGLRDLILDGRVKPYSDTRGLIKNLLEGGINVFYPPKDFSFEPEIMENFCRRNLSDKSIETKQLNWLNFELIYYLMQYRFKKHTSWFCDEVHSLIPSTARDMEWHVLDWFGREVDPELRRCHISSIGNTHRCTNVDRKHMNIQEWFVWTGGAEPDRSYSMVRRPAVARCGAGRCILEKKGWKFGMVDYEKLNGQLPKIRVVRGGIDKIQLNKS